MRPQICLLLEPLVAELAAVERWVLAGAFFSKATPRISLEVGNDRAFGSQSNIAVMFPCVRVAWAGAHGPADHFGPVEKRFPHRPQMVRSASSAVCMVRGPRSLDPGHCELASRYCVVVELLTFNLRETQQKCEVYTCLLYTSPSPRDRG